MCLEQAIGRVMSGLCHSWTARTLKWSFLPAPAWTSADVVRHLSGISQDMINGVFEAFASDEWTDAQIQARAELSLDEVLSEWRSTIDEVVDSLDSIEKLDVPDMIESALGRIPSSVIPAMAVSYLLHH